MMSRDGARAELAGLREGLGDPLERHASRLARALAAVINVVDPDVIVLGGGLSRIASLYREVPARWTQYAFLAGADRVLRTRLVASVHGDASGVRGAARL